MVTSDGQAMLSGLTVERWRQFSDVDIRFHPRLTVLTGENATGKTTLLGILSPHFSWFYQVLGVPIRKQGSTTWHPDGRIREVGQSQIGTLTYAINGSDVTATLNVQDGALQYDVSISGQQFVPGVYIPSHRSISSYQPISHIPIQFSTPTALFDQYMGESRNRWQGGSSRGPLTVMKEALVAAAIHGEGNRAVEPNAYASAVWSGFQTVLEQVLPPSLEFESLVVRLPDLVLRTGKGDFLLESMSGGVSAIVELAWQIFLRSRDYDSFTVCIDEPENHLHPSLQRSLIPGLLAAFPQIRFIVATHSPFVVTAHPESHVYVLERTPHGVVSRLLDYANKSASSDETLRRVLGLPTTMPAWVEVRLAEVLSDFPTTGITPSDLARLRDSLTNLGLREEFPDAVDSLIGGNDASTNQER